MIVVLAVVLVAGAAVVVGGAVLAVRSRAPTEAGPAVVALAGGAILLVALVGAAFALAGLGGRDAPAERGGAPTLTSGPPTATANSSRPADDAGARMTIGGRLVRDVEIVASTGRRRTDPSAAVGDLEDGTVLRVLARGFHGSTAGRVEQCAVTGARARCGNPFPVTFDRGFARFQYVVTTEVLSGRGSVVTCRPDRTACFVRVVAGRARGSVETVFGGPAPRARLAVTPRPNDVEAGSVVLVEVDGMVPTTRARALLCAAPATTGSARCHSPEHATFTVDAEGRGSTRLVLASEVGARGVACGKEVVCAISVSTAGGFVPFPAVPTAFSAGPGASYDILRTAVGVAAAAVLLLLALFLVRTTDWRKPTEADTPALDAATFGDI